MILFGGAEQGVAGLNHLASWINALANLYPLSRVKRAGFGGQVMECSTFECRLGGVT